MDFASSSSTVANREHMFEKVVTPSDVGKLNRLVIPKQHAEKYFPLDSAAGEKGLLLNFDESGGTGKSWRFRYSYWSSSQSYVITKGWSRFVKDKQLFAGDVVSFFRGSGDGRFFIDWRRRPADRSGQCQHGISLHRPINLYHQHPTSWCYNPPVSVTPVSRPSLVVGPSLYNFGHVVISPSYSCLHNQFGAEAGAGPTRFQTVPVVSEKAASKRLRLFGVNMDCRVTAPKDQQSQVLASPPPHPHGGFSSQIRTSSSSSPSSSALHGGNLSSSAVKFLDKGKSSLSLDLGV